MVAAGSIPAFARDIGAPEVRDAGPGMGGPPQMDDALGVTVPIGKQPKSAGDAPQDGQARPNCGETVTMAQDGTETVTPKPCD
ncbi:hypothetical protein [Chenggangzhangella methanolivorans]|uniref:Uncharacterized protein n=1 Tax=Chenggangzhangella methanolivorans TaxID=1437009 RepID=A0A9E6RDL4_9HYPH|nr:hypothetical protein [Chenggangzhangella methanolivorans]QZN98836.1 hypothetical protein K6K41_18090 [Chenggangzhangella methanolivorans]